MLELLCGMIASGKSIYARKRADQGALIVCHDDLTEGLHGEYRYEPGLRDLYRGMMLEMARLATVAGRDVILDRTHLTRESRKLWVDAARSWQVPIVAIEFPVYDPAIHAQRRFTADPRGRSFDQWLEVARHHYGQRVSEPLWDDEGFAELRHQGHRIPLPTTAIEAGLRS